MNNSEPLNVAEKLSELIKCKTISYNEEERFDEPEFIKLTQKLEELFPECHKVMEKELINNFALVYCWKGKNESLDPAIFIAHYDVVPIDDESDWIHGPFSGDIADGFVWGRGAIDVKDQVCAGMQAAEELIKEGFTPERTIYMAWGGDEEVSGDRGARVISKEFEKKGIHFAYLMDEGGAITVDQLPMIEKPVAVIGVEEKGMLNLKLSCKGQTGHSSMPPNHTAIGTLSEAIKKIEDNPFPTSLPTSVKGLFNTIAPEAKGIYKLIFGNLGLFGGILKKVLAKSTTTNAMIRTSQSVNMINAGYKENVLPDRAECIVNLRIIPGETIESVKNRIEKVIDNPEIKVEISYGVKPNEAAKIKSLDSPNFKTVCETVKEVWPEAVPAPYLMMGGSDSKNYDKVADDIFRFSPMIVDQKELDGMHGTNERISIENLENMVRFYVKMIKKSC
ncbi:MAG: M20/M25/M40 family metallo-hydrolase [Spirochaetales bacterium]|nr:M20/M25/M40 family metallo-hydrolase [Spirochaetales bacterium]